MKKIRKPKIEVKLIGEAIKDLESLPQPLREECIKLLKKLSYNVNLGIKLENKNGRDLSDCYKLYFNNAKHRIVYRKNNNSITIEGVYAEVIGIGERDSETIYKIIAERLGRENLKDDTNKN